MVDFDDIVWLTADDVRGFNASAFYPGPSPGEYPERPIDGPVGNLPNHFTYGDYELDIVLIAAAYGHDIARAHSFRDGNKRTALLAMLAFLDDHGFEVDLPNDDTLVPIMEAVAAGITDAHGLYDTIINWIKPTED